MDFGASGWLIPSEAQKSFPRPPLILDRWRVGLFGTGNARQSEVVLEWNGVPLSAPIADEEFFTRIDDREYLMVRETRWT